MNWIDYWRGYEQTLITVGSFAVVVLPIFACWFWVMVLGDESRGKYDELTERLNRVERKIEG